MFEIAFYDELVKISTKMMSSTGRMPVLGAKTYSSTTGLANPIKGKNPKEPGKKLISKKLDASLGTMEKKAPFGNKDFIGNKPQVIGTISYRKRGQV